MLADVHPFHIMVVFIHADGHFRLADNISNLAAVIQNTVFHLVNITAKLRKLRAALDINNFIQIPLGDKIELIIDTVNALDHILIHITGDYIIQNHRNSNQAKHNPSHSKRNPPKHILAGNHTPDIIFTRLHKHTVGFYTIYMRVKTILVSHDRLTVQSNLQTVFCNTGQIRRADNISIFLRNSIIIRIRIDAQQGKI